MSILSRDLVQTVANSIGVTVSDDVAVALVADLEYRLRDLINESTKFMRHSRRQRLTTDDVTNAFCVRNLEPPYGWSNRKTVQFVPSCKSRKTLYYLDDPKISLESVINERLPPVPLDVTYTVHWMAIEGVQPAISQTSKTSEDEKRRTVEPIQKYNELDNEVKNNHPLSKELQFYYEKIVEAIFGESEELNKLALESVRQDSAIRNLTPYLILLITEQILKNMTNLKVTNSILRLINALLSNKNVLVEAYLHQLIPSILTFLVGRNLSKHPDEDHWSIRKYASKLIAYICKRYGTVYAMLQTRVTKTLLHALLGPDKSFTTNYGAIAGFHALGPEVIRLFLIPSLPEFKIKLEKALNISNNSSASFEKFNAKKCLDSVVETLAYYYAFLISNESEFTKTVDEVRSKFPFFADDVVLSLEKLFPNYCSSHLSPTTPYDLEDLTHPELTDVKNLHSPTVLNENNTHYSLENTSEASFNSHENAHDNNPALIKTSQIDNPASLKSPLGDTSSNPERPTQHPSPSLKQPEIIPIDKDNNEDPPLSSLDS